MSEEAKTGNQGPSDDREPFFSGQTGDPTLPYDGTNLGPGSQIGPFKLLGILGEGGYGLVYMAEQDRPIRRRVALKVIKPGMDSRQIVARFEAERQALALLDHPNIAHVYDAGATQVGRPYFAMEYVEGVPITRFCDKERLGIKERLQLFQQVCGAIQHAHQKGIIHRDLKPSNILVTAKDGQPLVKVIDFGVAKALAQPLTEKTLYTEQGQFIGTPDYMSPEQAEMDPQGIDTRSDVYSLGVVLYELLTGVLPFDPDELRSGGVEHIRTVIRGHEPMTPSTRLIGLGEESRSIADQRQTDPRTLVRSLQRELEWIPLKAMRKEISRRYQSVSELASDIENYMKGVPLLAGPESVAYRLKKFLQRHRGAIAATLAVFVTLVVGLAVSTTLYLRAEGSRVLAEEARQKAVTAGVAEQEQRRLAEAESGRAKEAEQQAKSHLTGLYYEQGRRYVEAGDLDRALVLLSAAMQNDGNNLPTHLLAQECIRRHQDPGIRSLAAQQLQPWQGKQTKMDAGFATSPDRGEVAFVDRTAETITLFSTDTGQLKGELTCRDVVQIAFVPGNRYLLAKVRETDAYHSIRVFDLQGNQTVTSIRRSNVDIDRLAACPHGVMPDRSQIELCYGGILVSRKGDWFAFLDATHSAEPESWTTLWDFTARELHVSPRNAYNSLLTGLLFMPPWFQQGAPVLVSVDCQTVCIVQQIPAFDIAAEFKFGAISGRFDPRGTRLLVQLPDRGVTLSDRNGNRVLQSIPKVLSLGYGFGPDGRRLVTMNSSATAPVTPETSESISVDLWDTLDGRHIVKLADGRLRDWHFSPDGRFLVTERNGGEISVSLAEGGGLVFEIPAQADQEVVDISPDSRWLVTCNRQGSGSISIWTLATGERFQPYETHLMTDDLASRWLIEGLDRICEFSHLSPTKLVRFNASGSALICGAGLLGFQPDSMARKRMAALVAAHIPLRLENGRIRSATERETMRARLDYFTYAKDPNGPEVVETLLALASCELQAGALDNAAAHLKRCQSYTPAASPDLDRRIRGTCDRLSSMYFQRGEAEERCGRHAFAIDNYRSSLEFREQDPNAMNRLAWVLATHPEQRTEEGREATRLAARACELTGWQDWQSLSTYAAALAGIGRFSEAVSLQEKAIKLLPDKRKDRYMANFQGRLRLFQTNQPYDWRPFLNLPTEYLLGWWTFDEPDPNVAYDHSGGAHTMSFVNQVHKVRCTRGNAIHFVNDSFARCFPVTELAVRDALAVAAWIKYDTGGKAYDQVVAGNMRTWWLCVSREGHMIFECPELAVPSTRPLSRVVAKTTINDGKWHHVVGVYDGRVLCVYLDGRLDASVDATGSLSAASDGIFLGWGKDDVLTWQGLMDDVRIYCEAIGPEVIAELYTAGCDGT